MPFSLVAKHYHPRKATLFYIILKLSLNSLACCCAECSLGKRSKIKNSGHEKNFVLSLFIK